MLCPCNGPREALNSTGDTQQQGESQPNSDRASSRIRSPAWRCSHWGTWQIEGGEDCVLVSTGMLSHKTKLYVDVPNYGELYIHFFNSFIPHTFLLDVANTPDTLLGTTRIKLSKAGNSLVFQWSGNSDCIVCTMWPKITKKNLVRQGGPCPPAAQIPFLQTDQSQFSRDVFNKILSGIPTVLSTAPGTVINPLLLMGVVVGCWCLVPVADIAFLFYFLAVPHGAWDLTSLTRDRTHALCIGSSES